MVSDVVYEQMDVQYYCGWFHSYHITVVCCSVHSQIKVVTKEVTDVNAESGVYLRAAKTVLMKVYILVAKWNVAYNLK